MLAFCFCLAIFLLWTAAGYAFLRVVDFTRNKLQTLLLAPPVGAVLTVIPVFTISRLGVPCQTMAPYVTLGLLAFGVWGFVRRANRLDYPQVLPFAGALFLALVLSGRPMLQFGFDWLSFCNDDMANYTLAAERFVNHGFFDLPTIESLAGGMDYSQNFWFMHARDAQRPGCELLIAWAAGLTGLSVHDVFMPTIIAMHLGLVSAAAGAVYRFRRRYWAAVVTCVLMAMSALSTFGAMYQLIAQVCGLSVLAVLTTILLRRFHTMRWNVLWRYGIAVGVVMAGLLIIYPEVTPFLGLSFFLYHGVQIVRHRRTDQALRIGAICGTAIVVMVVAMQVYAVNSLYFLMDQAQTGNANVAVQVKLFPFYLLPSGFANLWNLQRVSYLPPEPYLSISIFIALALTLFVIAAGIRQAWKGEASAIMTLIMLALAANLFFGDKAFGLYKLAMFLQPFMLGVLVIAVWWTTRKSKHLFWTRALPLALLAIASVVIQQSYVRDSSGRGTFAEIRNASEMRITSAFRKTLKDLKPESLVLDASNITLAKFEMVYTRGIETSLPAHDFAANIQQVDLGSRIRRKGIPEWSTTLIKAIKARKVDVRFNVFNSLQPVGLFDWDPFTYSEVGLKGKTPDSNQYLIAAGGTLTILNRTHNPPDTTKPFVAKPMDQVKNHLVFKFSEIGLPYFGGLDDDNKVSFFQLENDFLIQGQFAAVGRYLLFEVLNPTPNARMVVELTTSLKADARNMLPPAAVVGAGRREFDVLGRGATRMFSPPMTPQKIGERYYVLLDMGEFGTIFPFERHGLMNLWGRKILYDRRKLVGFARNISMVSDEEYKALTAPRSLASFPKDLLNPNLEYSGIYEVDGWVSDASYYYLDPAGATNVSVRGQIPNVNNPTFTTVAKLLVDGAVVAEKTLPCGDFEMTAAIPPGPSGRRKVELRFDKAQNLFAPDNRPVGARLTFIGFETPGMASLPAK